MQGSRVGSEPATSKQQVLVVAVAIGIIIAIFVLGAVWIQRVQTASWRFRKGQQLPDTAKVLSATWLPGKPGLRVMNVVIRLTRADGDLFCASSGVKLVELRSSGPKSWSEITGKRAGIGVGEAARMVDVTYQQGVPDDSRPLRLRIEGFAHLSSTPPTWWSGIAPRKPQPRWFARYLLTAPTVTLPASKKAVALANARPL
jgi:hypothetical protein